MNKITLLFCSFLILSSCAYQHDKAAPTDNTNTVNQLNNGTGLISFSQMQVVFAKCTQCHTGFAADGGVALDTYAGVRANLSYAANEINTGSMPPKNPLSMAERNLVQKWISQGAPEFGSSDDQTPTPTPTSTPINPAAITYADVKGPIFTQNCIQCHSGAKPAGDIALDNYASINTNLQAVGYDVIVDESMPKNGPPLSSDLKDLLQQWILNGAPDAPGGSGTPTPTPPPTPTPTPGPILTPTPIPSMPKPSPTQTPILRVTYLQVQPIFSQSCVSCHGATNPKKGVALDTFANVTKNIQGVQSEALTNKSMPPRSPLSASDQTLLQEWIGQGALEE